MTQADTLAATGVEALAARTREFVREVVLPAEERIGGDVHDLDPAVRAELIAAARDAGVYAPQLPTEWGGQGLDTRAQAVVFEEAGYALLGPLATGCAAPDEGNGLLLERVATPAQQERWLAPLGRGELRTCFAMTEPAPGAGSDPRALATRASRVEGGWRIDGRKWMITGARGASVAIVMARTAGEPGDAGGATMFLVAADNPGMRIVRDLETMDAGFYGGHAEIDFDDCRVGDDDVLGEVDRGFAYAQVRLAPARLTHCMRWLGLARRCHDLALAHATSRRAFGADIADLGLAHQLLADNEIDIAASRAVIAQAAASIDLDADAANASSIAKVFVSEAVGRIADRSVQLAGARGLTAETLLSRYWREMRAFRVYDGPSETHRWAIARRAVSRFRREGRA
ncbi:acyl-CoA dehydrogenase family protein [Microbacterium hominis]|uniref:Acyl-CoA dehydrogenase family protein n=1 Tax=Microbacterium hominis TaxID=162426 RepID=A0A7D4PPC6_9MICO|nr:acyl-CoA dehydrogenase family protein [Microbacterium hominis]QKJ20710.1 acyl-CoA dehydrogenase family protein [Microbacterium hominis]